MRSKLLTQDGKHQIILTPESSKEKHIISLINNQNIKHKEGFSVCASGFIKYYPLDEIDSLLLVIDKDEIL